MLRRPCSCIERHSRSFTTTTTRHAKAAAKGKQPVKRKSAQGFAKKSSESGGGGGGGSGGKSQMSAKVGAGNANRLVTLNKDAPRVTLDRISDATFTSDRHGTLLEVPDNIVQQLNKLELLQPKQGFSSFAQLATVVRQCSTDLVDALLSDGSKDRRVILDGPAGSGKSVAMLQAVALALSRRWVVVAIPKAESVVDSSHSYGFDKKRGTWRQDTYASELCARTAEANREVLQSHDCSREHKLDRHTLPANSSLHKLLQIGAADAAVAHDVFDRFMQEMNSTEGEGGAGRPKLLLVLDNLTIASIPTQYRTPEFEQVHPLDLDILKQFYGYLSGEQKLANGGAIVACTSSRPTVKARALGVALGGSGKVSPFEQIDGRIVDAIKDVPVIKVGPYTSKEAASVIRHYADCGLIRDLNLHHSSTEEVAGKIVTHASGTVAAAGLTETMIRQRAMMGGNLAREIFRACTKQY